MIIVTRILLLVVLLGLVGMILYFALSKKSSLVVKKAALGALIFILLSIGISIFLIFNGPGVTVASGYGPLPENPVQTANPGRDLIIVFIVLAVLLFIIFFLAFRDWRHQKKRK